MSLRRFTPVVLTPLLAIALVIAAMAPASAAPPARTGSTGTISTDVTGFVNDVAQSGTLVITRFSHVGNQVFADGLLTMPGVSRQVSVPVQHQDPSCPILNLTLGPLHLDLLGLRIDLNTIHLVITAQSGPGNLLGNLLCAVANLLNGTAPATGQLTNLLNQILAAL